MTNIFQALRESHETQRALCRRLLRIKNDLPERDRVFAELKRELEAHAAAEERFLYAPILMDDAGLSSSRHALAEHHEIEELLEDLSVRGKRGPSWMATARKLSHEVHHHLKEEESKFFQVAGRILTARGKDALGRRYLANLARMRKKLGGSTATPPHAIPPGRRGRRPGVAPTAG